MTILHKTLHGTVQITILDHHLIRVRWYAGTQPNPAMSRTWSLVDGQGNAPREGWARSAVDDLFPRPNIPIHESAEGWTFETPLIRVRVQRDPFQITWTEPHTGVELMADVPALSHRRSKAGIVHTLTRHRQDHYYGFGEMSGALDKHSRRMRLRNTDAFAYDAEHANPLYKHIPFYLTLRGLNAEDNDIAAYGLFYDTPFDAEFDMGAEINNYYSDYRSARFAGGDLDYYVILGGRGRDCLRKVVSAYTALTGRIPLPPRWTLGYLGSGMRYTEAEDAQTALAEFITLCQKHGIPCSGFHLSSGYTKAADEKRYVFTWNRVRVNNPQGMTNAFHKAGMGVIANVKPGILTTHPAWESLTAKGMLIRASENDQPDRDLFWGGEAGHLDFTNPATYGWWKDNITAQLLDLGVDHIWNDNNEFNLNADDARCHGFGQTTPLAALKPIQTFLMARASYEAQIEHAPEKTPFVLTRAGSPGTQRYAATWTGDNRSEWAALKYGITTCLGLSLCGFANVGMDIGGFAGDPPDPELFLRWVQAGTFMPRFCIHSWRSDEGENAPWMHPSVLPAVRDYIGLRYKLIPYLYGLVAQAAASGEPIMRPLVYDFPDDPKTHAESFAFLVGSDLLVAPVVEAGERTRRVYLPKGGDWRDWYGETVYNGGQTITLDAPLERIPLLVRAGATIPLE
ncbi:MAG TPA: glycoside hydrolase family 31 protein [Aggregatilineales bacterium]|nr:alpha-glucosidase [Anaerolineales bacterium]HRE49362.1 glycoside hydrolase family 31 protein [Aggregatilineales bacterium]